MADDAGAAEISGVIEAIRSDRDTMCLFLDPRTHHLHANAEWTLPAKVAAQNLVQQLYVDFYLNAERPTADLNRNYHEVADDGVLLFAVQAAPAPRLTLEEWDAKRKLELVRRFRQECKAYSTYLLGFDWKAYGNKHGVDGIPADGVDPLMHLMNVNILPLIAALPAELANLQCLLTHSKASVACLPAASFAERMNSLAGIVSTKKNTRLDFSEIAQLVPLRMNQKFLADIEPKLARAAAQAAAIDV